MIRSMLDSSGMQIAISFVQTNPGGIRHQDARCEGLPKFEVLAG